MKTNSFGPFILEVLSITSLNREENVLPESSPTPIPPVSLVNN